MLSSFVPKAKIYVYAYVVMYTYMLALLDSSTEHIGKCSSKVSECHWEITTSLLDPVLTSSIGKVHAETTRLNDGTMRGCRRYWCMLPATLRSGQLHHFNASNAYRINICCVVQMITIHNAWRLGIVAKGPRRCSSIKKAFRSLLSRLR